MPVAELVKSDIEQETLPPTLGYDRRRSTREAVCERAMLATSSENGFQRLIGVELLDVSAEGFGIFSTERVSIGEPCTIFRDELHPGRTAGVLTRITPAQGGFILGISTCDLLAA